jgi:DNA invertase Pin-like site-specific DNA recombinase
MRVALYLRVSSRDKGQDTENQAMQLRQFCKSCSYDIVCEYVDRVTASGRVERDYFKQMLSDASKRKFDLVLFWALDRFSREGVLKTLNYLQMLTDYGIAYKSYTEQYLDSCGIFKDAVISILATVAKQERIRIGERVKAGMERAKAKGVSFGRRPLAVRKGIDPQEVEAMRRNGMSLRAIASRLKVSPASVLRISRSVSQAPPKSSQQDKALSASAACFTKDPFLETPEMRSI